MSRKKKSIKELAEGIKTYEDRKKSAQNADFTDLESFRTVYLNEPDPKQRKKLAEEYKKRHTELAAFLDANEDLVSADTKITTTIQTAVSGVKEETEDKQMSNLFEKLEARLK